MPRAVHAPLSQPIFHEPVFDEGVSSRDPEGFLKPHPSDTEVYKQIENLLTKDVVGFDKSRVADGEVYSLQDALGAHGSEIIRGIKKAGQVVFHALGDSGASNQRKYKSELGVADQLALEAHSASAELRPAFLFHLGDVVYDFGEAQYYYDQFYEPFRNYPCPIFGSA